MNKMAKNKPTFFIQNYYNRPIKILSPHKQSKINRYYFVCCYNCLVTLENPVILEKYFAALSFELFSAAWGLTISNPCNK